MAVMPSDQMSAFSLYPSADWITSGAIQNGVPADQGPRHERDARHLPPHCLLIQCVGVTVHTFKPSLGGALELKRERVARPGRRMRRVCTGALRANSQGTSGQALP